MFYTSTILALVALFLIMGATVVASMSLPVRPQGEHRRTEAREEGAKPSASISEPFRAISGYASARDLNEPAPEILRPFMRYSPEEMAAANRERRQARETQESLGWSTGPDVLARALTGLQTAL